MSNFNDVFTYNERKLFSRVLELADSPYLLEAFAEFEKIDEEKFPLHNGVCDCTYDKCGTINIYRHPRSHGILRVGNVCIENFNKRWLRRVVPDFEKLLDIREELLTSPDIDSLRFTNNEINALHELMVITGTEARILAKPTNRGYERVRKDVIDYLVNNDDVDICNDIVASFNHRPR